MRDDLLDAQEEAVNWAVAQIEVLKSRINRWVQTRPYMTFAEPDGNTGYEFIKARLRGEPLPLIINAEAGAIINMIRSSLDILAVALAVRNGHKAPKDVYFPIASCVLDFIDPMHGAIKKIARLSQADRSRIEQLKPYDGGDNVLSSLHQLDIMRKHRKLVGASARMGVGSIWYAAALNSGPADYLSRYGPLEDGAPLWRVPREANAQAQLSIHVSFTETAFAQWRPIMWALKAYAARAGKIIAMFDTP